MRLSADGIITFAREWDPQPFHVDQEAAARSQFGGLVASGAHTFALAARLFTTTLGVAFIAGRGFDRVRLLRPLRPDVDVHLEIRVVRVRPGPYPASGQSTSASSWSTSLVMRFFLGRPRRSSCAGRIGSMSVKVGHGVLQRVRVAGLTM